MDEISVPGSKDPFDYAGEKRSNLEDERPHGCIDGWVYIGHIVIDEDGEEVEVIEQVRCRRCQIAEHYERF